MPFWIAIVRWHVERLPDGADGALDGERIACGDRSRDGVRRAIPQLVAGTTSLTRPRRSAVSAVMRSSVPISAQRSTSPSGTPRCSMPIGSSADTMPRVGVRVEELGVVGADDDVGLVDEVLTAAGAHAVHRGDDRLPHLVVELRRQLAPGSNVFQMFGRTTVRRSSRRGRWRTPARRWPAGRRRGCRRCRGPSPTPSDLGGHRLVERVQRSGRSSVIVATCSLMSKSMVSSAMLNRLLIFGSTR